MKSLKDKQKNLDKDIKSNWNSLESTPGLSTKEKLDRLVRLNLRRREAEASPEVPSPDDTGVSAAVTDPDAAYFIRDFFYPLSGSYRQVILGQWREVTPNLLALLGGNPAFGDVDPQKVVFLDTETTGLAGGTGTVPFIIGLGFLEGDSFHSRIFVLNDLAREAEMLEAVEALQVERHFSALATFNGRAFDLPLLEARYILAHRRCPFLSMPHLDFLYPARTLWRHTYDSRKLGFLADVLLGISRSEDIDASQIPALYFSYVRTRLTRLIDPIIEHNALDLVSLAVVLLLALRYLEDPSLTGDEGEVLGLAMIFERGGRLQEAEKLYTVLRESAMRSDVLTAAAGRHAMLLKKQRLFLEALDLWRVLAEARQHLGFRELSVHYEHREKNLKLAMETVQAAIDVDGLPEGVRRDMEKRLLRLRRKIAKLEAEGDEEAAESSG